MCARGADQALLGGPSTSPLDSMTAVPALSKIRHYALVALWVAWATVLWGAFSAYMFKSTMRVPYPIELLTVLSGAIAFIGGCFGALYLILAARSWQRVLSGVCATAANFGYMWWYANAIFHQ